MKARKWTSAVLMMVGFVLVGCQSGGTIDTGSGAPREVASPSELIAQSRPPVPDVPLPIKFTFEDTKSRSYAVAGIRIIDHSYVDRSWFNKADKWAVGRFYKRQMLVNRWTLESDQMVRGTICLQFNKDKEHCKITITDNDSPVMSPTRVAVEVMPLGKVEVPVDR